LSQRNYGIDVGFYPLGSCTMKYNPRINEKIAALSGFTHAHPLQPESLSQGALQLMYELQQDLKAITGFAAVTLQNVAGAHGVRTMSVSAQPRRVPMSREQFLQLPEGPPYYDYVNGEAIACTGGVFAGACAIARAGQSAD